MTRLHIFVVMLVVFVLTACGGSTPDNFSDRNEVLGEGKNTSNYQEALQIRAVEDWKDQSGKIVNLYLINTVTGKPIVPVIRCMGVPNSSTESLEPNHGYTGSAAAYVWHYPVDGLDIYSDELPGRDGTFGDPVPFRYCMGLDGNYTDFPAITGAVFPLVDSRSYTFEGNTVERDFETEARLLQAEVIIRRGGCVNPETLVEQACPATPTPAPTVEPTATGVQ